MWNRLWGLVKQDMSAVQMDNAKVSAEMEYVLSRRIVHAQIVKESRMAVWQDKFVYLAIDETCACSDCEEKKNGCEEGYYCSGGSCIEGIPGSVTDCSDYCVYLGEYTGGVCRQNPSQCTKYDETYESGGDTYCIGGTTGDSCCCAP